jgi:hypothetical protein
MSTEYIVKFSRNIENYLGTSDPVDGFVKLTPLNDTLRVPTISVRTCKESTNKDNISLLFKFITSNFAKVEFNDDRNICSMTYKDGYSRSLDYTSEIIFDSSSSSAYTTFKTEFKKLLNSKKETEYYNSGQVKYVGDILTDEDEQKYHGDGTIYYDSYYNRPQYVGEFEDNMFDGSGKFYNYDNNIMLEANNISSGIPVQKGNIYINFRHHLEVIHVDFDELWLKFELKDRHDKREFVKSTNFVNMIASSYLENSDKKMDQLIFEDRSTSDQNIAIWKDIQLIREELQIIRNDTNININNFVQVGKGLSSVIVLNILLAVLYFNYVVL